MKRNRPLFFWLSVALGRWFEPEMAVRHALAFLARNSCVCLRVYGWFFAQLCNFVIIIIEAELSYLASAFTFVNIHQIYNHG